MNLLQNRPLLCALSAWLAAQICKVFITLILTHKLEIRWLFSSGGMPSAHTACVVALAVMTGFTEGMNSTVFAVSVMFAVVVMYDATGVRRETGRQGKVINQILKHMLETGQPISDENLKELVGHTPLQVFFGFITGLAIALIWTMFP